jgi:L-lactate permease
VAVDACTATNRFGHEGSILRFAFKHSIALACLVGVRDAAGLRLHWHDHPSLSMHP